MFANSNSVKTIFSQENFTSDNQLTYSKLTYLNPVELKALVNNILSGNNVSTQIRDFGNLIHPRTAKTNFNEHKEQVYSFINKIKDLKLLDESFKSYVLTSIKFGDANIIDINMYVYKKNNEISFYFVGKDLANHYTNLPLFSVISNGKREIIRPKTGTNNSKWYPYKIVTYIVQIAVNLRLLELYLRSLKRDLGIVVQKSNIVGSSNVPISIPPEYNNYLFLTNPNELNSNSNPIKIKPGLFIFQRNGVTTKRINQMIGYIRETFYHISNLIYPKTILSNDLSSFYNSKYIFGITSWDRHASLLIKINKTNLNSDLDLQEDTLDSQSDDFDKDEEDEEGEEDEEDEEDEGEEEDEESLIELDMSNNLSDSLDVPKLNENNNNNNTQFEIWIIDPWKNKLKQERWNSILSTNSEIKVNFISRRLKDQGKEGSCVLCAFARLLFLANSINLTIPNNLVGSEILIQTNLSTPIPDFFAYLTSFIFRNCVN